MRPDQSDDVVREIRAELMAVEPSPAFAAGVRTRVEGRREGASSFWLNTAAAGVIVAVVGLGVIRWAGRSDVGPDRRAVVTAISSPTAPTLAPLSAQPSGAPAPVRPGRRVTGVTARVGPQVEVLVPPDQAMAIRRLLLGQRQGRGVLPAAPEVDWDGQEPILALPTVALIKIEPIQVPPLGGEGKDK